jgi:hypothetical protein
MPNLTIMEQLDFFLKFIQPGSWTLLAGLSSLLEWANEYYIRPVGWNVGCRVMGYAKLTFLKFTSKACDPLSSSQYKIPFYFWV